MSIRMYMPSQFAQRSADGKITLHVSRAHEMPPLPYELSGLMAHEQWDQRTQTIKAMCARFSKPLIERVWFLVAMISTLILPFPLYRLVFNAIFDPDRSNETFYEARAAGFGIFVAVMVVFWVPLAVWKFIGAAKMRAQLRQWDTYDRANASGRFVPEWKVEMPGIFSVVGRVTITTPPNAAPTVFAPGAYLPPYINAPAYMQGAPVPPQGPMAYNGGGPGFGYSGPDEKSGFHDVNLKV
ncbi:hypothetical protein RhiJN_07279 [Ceratobasidium sp. AG-Ba]|nr:hypothetical protein RhiJN_07279 [Ceratobasidium sp. AG-Ba]QRW08147.1 hypothetical protein RhiLY_07146 [Ceratobasidium sp. AG-Ba]